MVETSLSTDERGRGGEVAALFANRSVKYVFAFAVYLVATCLYFAPLVSHLDSRVLMGLSDATSAIRTYDVMAAAGANPFTFRHDALNGAPEGMPVLPQTQIAQPVQGAVIWSLRDVVGTVAALNLFFLCGFALTALAGFVLLDWARFGMLASLFGGFVVAFNPWMVEQAITGHVAFVHGWIVILLLAALTKLRAVRTLRWAAIAGLVYGSCFLVAAYMGFLATALVAAFAIVDLLAQRSPSEWLWTCSLLAVIAGVTLLALAPGITAYAFHRSATSAALTHSTDDLVSFGAKPAAYLLPVPRHPVLGSVSRLRPANAFHEQHLFVGYVVLALACVTTLRLIRGRANLPSVPARHLVALSVAVVPIAFLTSMQRQLTVLGVAVPMPSYLIGSVTTFYRTYARFGYIVEIGLAMLATAALFELARRPRRGLALAVVLVLVTVFEFLPGTLSTVDITKPPAYDAWLARQPAGIAAHYPMIGDSGHAEGMANAEFYYQRFTLQPLYEILGPERQGTREDAIRLQSRSFGSPDTLGILAAEGVRYLVIHEDVYKAQGEEPPALGAGARLLRNFGSVRIYRLTAKPIDLPRYLRAHAAAIADQFGLVRPTVSLEGGFYPPESYQGFQTSFQWMRRSGEVDVENTGSRTIKVWLEGLGFSNGTAQRLDLADTQGRRVASVNVPTSLIAIRLGPIEVPPGISRWTLNASPGPSPLGAGDSRVASVYLSDLSGARVPDLSRTLRQAG